MKENTTESEILIILLKKPEAVLLKLLASYIKTFMYDCVVQSYIMFGSESCFYENGKQDLSNRYKVLKKHNLQNFRNIFTLLFKKFCVELISKRFIEFLRELKMENLPMKDQMVYFKLI